MKTFARAAEEGVRYVAASALALTLDLGTYSGLIRLAGVNYLVAAPVGFALGLVAIYVLSVGWVFHQRRLKNARAEFALFILLSLIGMGLNQVIVYSGVEFMGFSYELAKIPSAGMVFCFNYASRKLLLFTRYR